MYGNARIDLWKFVKIYGNVWKIYGNALENLWKCIENLWKCMEMY